MPTFLASISVAALLIAVVIFLVRRDRRERDLERRALARSVAILDIRNERLQDQIRRLRPTAPEDMQ